VTRATARPNGVAVPQGDDAFRRCDHPTCEATGRFPAPKARDRLREYWWLCLDHVRAYNAGWNFHAGMSAAEIDAERRRDTVWQRPSWRFGTAPPGARGPRVDDPFGLFGGVAAGPGAAAARSGRWPPGSREARALAVLGLDGDGTLAEVKARRRMLAKRHHPDANGGCRQAEERLKRINEAYMTLASALTP
jgi:hypothetical protein